MYIVQLSGSCRPSMNMYDGKYPNDFITFEMMGTEHEFPQQNVHVSLEHCLFYHHCSILIQLSKLKIGIGFSTQ